MRLDNVNPVSNADWLVTIEGLEGYFSELSGYTKTFNRPTFSDGLSNVKRTAKTGSIEYSEISISKAFDPDTSDPLLQFLIDHEDGSEFDVTCRPVKRGPKGVEFRGKKAWHFSYCKIKTIEYLNGINTGDGAAVSMIKVTFTVEGATFN